MSGVGAARGARLAAVLGTLLALGGCGEGSSGAVDDRLFVFLEGLSPLGDPLAEDASAGEEFEYALWRDDVAGTAPRLLERFSTRTGVVNLSLDVNDIGSIATLFVTIEARGQTPRTPSASVLLGGDLIDGRSVMRVDHPIALATGFDDASATFRLATPTSLDESDFDQGLWWYDVDGEPVQSLFLPTLPQGWLYEGWILSGTGARSSGKFADPARFDLDAGGATAGAIAPPAFPGQDYVTEPLALIGASVAITVEPNPDNAIGPFGMRVLFDQVIEGVRVNQPMANVAVDRLPGGLVTTNRPR